MATPRYCVLIAEIDGTELEYSEELALDSINVYFNNTTNGFVADNNQEAIEEAKATADAAVYPITLQHNGTVSGGTFFGASALIPGDDTPIIVGVDSEFTNYTFSNKKTNADYTLLFRKGSTTATPFYTVSKTNTQFFTDTLGTPESFNEGDEIYIEYQDDGQNASDVAIVLYFKAT